MQEILDWFSDYLRQKGAAKSTVRSYLASVRLYHSRYETVTVTHLKDYKDWLLSHYKTATVNARIYGINQYTAALRTPDSPFRPVLSADVPPAFQLPSVRQQQKAFLNNVISKRDYERLKRRLKKDNCLFWYFVVRYLGATGARVGELVQIKAEHIQLGYMDLYAKGGKVRRIFFPEKLCEETLLWLRERHISTGFIFTNRYGQQISARGISSRLKFFARKYKIPPENVYPHSFRHRFAKNFLEKFNDISLLADLMGHDSIETTRIYLTKSSEEQRTLIDKIVTW